MQTDSSSSVSGRCICCLVEGKHQHGAAFIDTFRKCFNLIMVPESHTEFPMCSACVSFVNEVQEFREMVLSSQRQLQKTDVQDDKDEKDAQQTDTNSVEEDDSDWEPFAERKTNLQQNSSDPTYVDETNVCTNVVLILKHSTVIPFSSKTSTFRCFYCKNFFVTFKELREHTETDHRNVCDDTITKIIKSSQEIITYVDISGMKCKLCDKKLESVDGLMEHLCKIHDKTFHESAKKTRGVLAFDMSMESPKCHICGKHFSYFRNLKVHMNEHFGYLVCFVCGKKFMSKKRYESHVSTAHTDNERIECRLCDKVLNTKAMLQYHLDKVHRKRTVKCLKCPKTFPYKHYMKRAYHMAEVHGIKRPVFKCETCDREYQTPTSLSTHKRLIHKRTREFKCEICGYVTTDGSYIKKHLDMHKGVKKYECDLCNKKLATSTSLRLHKRIHTNDKPFSCSLCDAAFIQKHCLRNHMKSKHPNRHDDSIKKSPIQ